MIQTKITAENKQGSVKQHKNKEKTVELFLKKGTTKQMPNKLNYHSLYSILNFDCLIYLQITACK
jgi:hypothetical protein